MSGRYLRGNEALAALVSSRPGEGHWYCPSGPNHFKWGLPNSLHAQRSTGIAGRPLPRASIWSYESLCSDRGQVVGEARVIEIASGTPRTLNVCGLDIKPCGVALG